MDFTLIRRHPWVTAVLILSGGLLLWWWWRRRSAASTAQADTTGGAYYAYSATDPNAAAYNAQTQQLQAQLQAYSMGAQTQVQLAQIAAGPNYQTQVTGDIYKQQIAAQLSLGEQSQQAQIQLAQIQADLQKSMIEAITGVYGAHTTTSPSPIYTAPAGGSTAPVSAPATTATVNPAPAAAQPVYASMPAAVTPIPAASAGASTPALGYYDLLNMANRENCNPRDSACVARNQQVVNAVQDYYFNVYQKNPVPISSISFQTGGTGSTQAFMANQPVEAGITINGQVISQPTIGPANSNWFGTFAPAQ